MNTDVAYCAQNFEPNALPVGTTVRFTRTPRVTGVVKGHPDSHLLSVEWNANGKVYTTTCGVWEVTKVVA